ncbi:hypothetical protein QR680_013266 [Steinernema hermaphroditum]|uniref:BHLH domain-containing protein n=1 Tax=Steinernema hermaphroditum TaxID=289476 RepID=A0AA39I4X7_9BILA|nr:hypothetical protein QR680_013266 [Steinernema hermaphroditum]
MALRSKGVSESNLGKLISGKEEAICVAVAQQFEAEKSLEEMVEIRQIPNPHFGGAEAAQREPPVLRPVVMRQTSPKRRLNGERPSVAVAKRNARERTRVHTVNQAFLVLKFHLPALRANSKRVSKLKILRAAINYIYSLADWLKTANKSSAAAESASKALKLSQPLAVVASQQQTPATVPKFSLCESLSAASYMKSFNEELVSSLYHSTAASGLVSPSANPYMIDPFYYSSAYVPNGAAAGLYNPTVYP